MLTGIPFTSGAADCELLTPTGAALLRHFASGFGPMPPMAVRRIGTGCGTRELTDRPNVLRAFWGEDAAGTGGPNGCVTELKANIDDMTGEQLAFACEQLRAAGALGCRVVSAAIATGDQFIERLADKQRIARDFSAAACDMEGGAIAQVCCLNDVPYVEIRAISDKPDETEFVEYSVFEAEAAAHCAHIVEYMVEELA